MAIAERHLNAEFGDELVDHRTWAIAGDGCLMEGVNHEAASLAGHLGLGRLKVFWDDNRITIDGSTELSTSEEIKGRYLAYGWHVVSCDGHDFADIRRAIDEAVADQRPSLIACRTIIGKGAPNKQGTSATHGAALGADEVAAARKQLLWDSEPFDIPSEILAAWRAAGRRTAAEHEAWIGRLAASPAKDEFLRRMDGRLPDEIGLDAWLDRLAAEPLTVATRKASELALEAINAAIPDTIGGSADLTGSNNTKTKSQKPLTRDDYSGRYIYYGIREFGMAAAMNGMALHGGVIPYGGTFLVFADYCRPAIRLSALQGVRVVYVMTHDSIGLGEDGPTHQPVEHLTSLRLIPNLEVLRPADAVETAECWELALRRSDGPTVLALTRQNLPQLRLGRDVNRSAQGAYRLRAATAPRRVVIVATGSEVALGVEVAEALEGQGIGADVVSMPSWRRFDAQDAACRSDLLPEGVLKVSIEAGATLGWERYIGPRGLAVGLDRFGASAPGEDLFKRFGFTAEAIVPEIVSRLKIEGDQ
jgi:transketolase